MKSSATAAGIIRQAGGSHIRRHVEQFKPTWPARLMRSVPIGRDLSMVWPKFALWLLTEVRRRSRQNIRRVVQRAGRCRRALPRVVRRNEAVHRKMEGCARRRLRPLRPPARRRRRRPTPPASAYPDPPPYPAARAAADTAYAADGAPAPPPPYCPPPPPPTPGKLHIAGWPTSSFPDSRGDVIAGRSQREISREE